VPENPVVNPADILTPEELAKKLKVPRGWISEKVRRRKQGTTPRLPHFKCGKYLRFYWPDVAAWLLANRVGKEARP
jgi:hypothetical protein